MTGFYLRWSGLTVVALILAGLASQYYERHLTSVTPEAVLTHPPTGEVRVQGMVEAGTLEGEPEGGRVRFRLGGAQDHLAVEYVGPPPENLRELKTLIVIGRWDPEARALRARDVALVTNYGFVVGAYLIGLLPLALLLFTMERKVGLLYHEIKQSKAYEPETGEDGNER